MKVHFIPRGDGSCVMFFCDSLRYYNVNSFTRAIVEDIIGGASPEDIMQRHRISQAAFDKINTVVENGLKERPFIIPPTDKVSKLTFNVSNNCNLACAYCYANCGTYGSAAGLMSKEVAKQAIDVFLSRYSEIEKVVFFGGEPMLNIDTIEFICSYFNEKYNNGELKSLPIYGMVSNGTIYTERIASVVREYGISITVSLDGPAEINDELRRFKLGGASTGTVLDNIRRYKAETGEPSAIEATYTGRHIKKGIPPAAVAKYIKDELMIDDAMLGPVSAASDSDCYIYDLDYYLASVDDVFEQYRRGQNYFYAQVLTTLDMLNSKEFQKASCNASLCAFAVNSEGDVYPCHLFTDRKDFYMGNVFKDLFNGKEFAEIQNRFLSHVRLDACADCFARGACNVCPGANVFSSGDAFVPGECDCEMQKRLLEKVLLNVSAK